MTDVFSIYFSTASGPYCYQLWQQYGFNFRVVKPRRTRLGDFRVFPNGQTQITVNANLNTYAFLITYVHEVAHAAVDAAYKSQRRNRMKPHGQVWQAAFQRLMQPILTEDHFSLAILAPLRQYMDKPAATTYAHPALMVALRQADKQGDEPATTDRILLRDVLEGDTFQFAKKTFVRGTLRRTRIVCKEVSSGKSYAILAHAWVEK